MLDPKTLSAAISQIAEEKNLPFGKVKEAIEAAVATAYKREYRHKGEIVRAILDLKSGEFSFFDVKEVLSPEQVKSDNEAEGEETEEELKIKFNPERHLLLQDALKVNPDVKAGDEIVSALEHHDEFGRIAAQTAKQVIFQKLRESEKESLYGEFKTKESTVISGIIQRIEGRNVYIDLGKANGIMFAAETIPNEHYKISERYKFYVYAVQKDSRGIHIFLSRSHPQFVVKLFETEVPEIAEGIVLIKSIAREPGSRSKIAVYSTQPSIDAIGCCVGQRGIRVAAIINELNNEKIDIVEWSESAEKFVANALAPARAIEVEQLPKRTIKVLMPEDQLSLAIGRKGQNVRLAAKLTGWRIDIRSSARPEEEVEGGVAEAEILAGQAEPVNQESKSQTASEKID